MTGARPVQVIAVDGGMTATFRAAGSDRLAEAQIAGSIAWPEVPPAA
jgi:hypothetical protein